jgi:hypothetical protein
MDSVGVLILALGVLTVVVLVIRGLASEKEQPSLQEHPSGHGNGATGSQPAGAVALSPSPPKEETRKFVPEVADQGKTAFANLIKSLVGGNSQGCTYWAAELLKAPSGDAIEYTTRVFEAAWSSAIIGHTKIFRNVMRLEQMPKPVPEAFEQALGSLERLLSYEELPPIPKMVVPDDTRLPETQMDRVVTIFDYIQRGISNDDEIGELYRLAETELVPQALQQAFLGFITSEPALIEEFPIDFANLACVLATLGESEASRPNLARRCVALAGKCASLVHRENPRFANVATRFKECGLAVPPFKDRSGRHSVRLALDGSIRVVDRDSPRDSTASQAAGVGTAVAAIPKTEGDVLRAIEKSLVGLVGLDRMKPLIAMDLFEFLSAGQSRGRVFWGASGVGKTELAQRLAGLREGFPGLALGPGQVRYVSGVDGKLEIKEIIDSLPPRSVLFIDEADKCLDPKAGMVTPAEATQIRHAIVTHFQRKPILWVFLGVFSQMRNGGVLTDDSLRVTFGDELAHRLDYADWGFPAWSLENLLKAVNSASSRRKLRYDDAAALLLAEYCIKTGGGVRAFDNLETAIVRHVRTTGADQGAPVGVSVAREVLAKRGVQAS